MSTKTVTIEDARTKFSELLTFTLEKKEVIEMLLGDGEPRLETEFIGTQTVIV